MNGGKSDFRHVNLLLFTPSQLTEELFPKMTNSTLKEKVQLLTSADEWSHPLPPSSSHATPPLSSSCRNVSLQTHSVSEYQSDLDRVQLLLFQPSLSPLSLNECVRVCVCAI